jgi:hypothetical protein
MGNQLEKKEYRDLLEDICSEYCEPKRYCILKEFLVSSHPSHRLLAQLKCVDKVKFEESKKIEKDIGWTEALKIWVDDGYAKKFAEVYEENIKFSVLYKKIRNGK